MQTKAALRAQLQKDIDSLQGYKPSIAADVTDTGLNRMAQAFSQASFPFTAIHEFFCSSREQVASSCAFITALLSCRLHPQGTICWITSSRLLFPPALRLFGINPQQIIFIELTREKDVMMAIEETLRCSAVTTVVAEMAQLDFTRSRRLQLRVEQSGVGCFILRYKPRNLSTVSAARWQVTPVPSFCEEGLPGIGYPRWQVELTRVKNGRSGNWVAEWDGRRLRHPSKLTAIPLSRTQRKTV